MRPLPPIWLGFLFYLFLILPQAASGQFRCLETPDLRLVYDEINLGYLAPHTARCFENSMRFQRKLFDYEPWEKVSVILNDFADYGNAGAGASPRNSLSVGVAPNSLTYETYPSNERVNTLMNHELVHIAALDGAAASDRFFRRLFLGKVRETSEQPETILYGYLTAPRNAAPRWYHEGIAVFIETWMAGGYGRALGAYDEMVFRAMVRDSSHFYDPLGLVSEGTEVDFQVGVNAYLYGTRFMSYLAYTYSPESLIRWVARGEGTKGYYAAQFERVFGQPIEEAWADWIAFEHRFQERNLEAIRSYPITPCRDIASNALGSVSRAYYDPDTRTLYAGLNYPGEVAHIAAISVDDGSIRKISEVKGPALYFVTALAYDPAAKRLFYTTDNNTYRDLRVLDPQSGKSETLIKDFRTGDLAFSVTDSCLWGVRHYNGIATLARIPPPYTQWHQVHSWPYGWFIYDIDVSPDGGWLSASVGEVSGRQTVRVMNLEALASGDTTSVATIDFGAAVPGNFIFSADGKYLYGSSYYTGVSNIFRYDLAADSLAAVSNCETGFFRPVPIAGDSLIVFRYTGQGFIPALMEAVPLADVSAIQFFGQEIVEKHPVVKDWLAGSPASIDLDSLGVSEDRYKGIRELGLESVYPVLQGYKDFAAFGYRVNLSDPVFLHQVDLTASYTPSEELAKDERLHLNLHYHRYNLGVTARYNAADFYDLFGPTKSGRKGYSLGGRYKWHLVYDQPRTMELNLGSSAYWGLERLPEAQNVTVVRDKLFDSDVRLLYRNIRSSLGAVEMEKGLQWELAAANRVAGGSAFPRVRGDLHFGFPVLVGHSSLWIRNSAGYSPGDRDEPSANFYFGGFGNNWVDVQDAKRFREHWSFPGLELNEVGGTNYSKVLLEWNLPPLRFRRAGTPGLYATWARLTLFSSGLITNLESDPDRRTLVNAGSQVDLRFRALSRLRMTMSFGYAVAFERGRRKGDEFMASLKVL